MPSCIRSRRAAAESNIEVRLMSRSNEVLAIKRTDANGHVQFEANLTRGEGGLSPALAGRRGQQRRLRLPQPEIAGLRPVRSRRRRPQGAGWARCVRLYRARRLSHRRDRAYHRAAARRAGAAANGVPLTLVVERPDGVEYRRTSLPDQGLGGRSLSPADRRDRLDRHLAGERLHRPEASGDRRSHLHGRRLCAGPAGIRAGRHRPAISRGYAGRGHARRPLSLWRARRQSRSRRRGAGRARQGAAGLPRLSVRHRRTRK